MCCFSQVGVRMFRAVIVIPFIFFAQAALADNPKVTTVRAAKDGGLWTFTVTLRHGDTGWGHFSDAWRVVDAEGNQIAIRELIHPHVDEQPLTRSLSGVDLPASTKVVGIQARDTVAGWSTEITRVDLK